MKRGYVRGWMREFEIHWSVSIHNPIDGKVENRFSFDRERE